MAYSKKKQKKSNFVSKSNKDFEVYKNGAFIGGLIGGITGLVIGRKIFLGIVIGAIVGGYINYEVNKEDRGIFNLKKFKELNGDKEINKDINKKLSNEQ